MSRPAVQRCEEAEVRPRVRLIDELGAGNAVAGTEANHFRSRPAARRAFQGHHIRRIRDNLVVSGR